jgi:hypothetical protein
MKILKFRPIFQIVLLTFATECDTLQSAVGGSVCAECGWSVGSKTVEQICLFIGKIC